MRVIQQMAFVAGVLMLVDSGVAWAQSGRLWSERPSSSTPMAQVPDFTRLADQLVPAVVSIQVEQKARVSRRGSRGDPFDYFHRWFGESPRRSPSRGIGSGFVISKDGLILTNNHVVEGADNIEVTFAGLDGTQKTMSAEVLGTAPRYDVALIKTRENAKAPVAFLGNSDNLKIGDWVMAIGNPFGLSHSVSVGIVSAKERRGINPSGRAGLYDFIQTDASINPGNSGGPLINMRGEVIGINTAINAAGSGIGFAIPINMVKGMLPELKEKGSFTRSWIGIRIQQLSDELAQSYGLDNAQGALVSEVVSGGPADKAGLKAEDVILEFDDKPVRTSSDLPLYASMAGVGKEVTLKFVRNGRQRRAKVRLAAFPNQQETLASSSGEAQEGLGIVVADINPELSRQFGLEDSQGVVLKDVDPNSVAAQKGLMPGDVILSLNSKRVKTAREFANAVRRIDSGGLLRLQISRKGAKIFLAMRKP